MSDKNGYSQSVQRFQNFKGYNGEGVASRERSQQKSGNYEFKESGATAQGQFEYKESGTVSRQEHENNRNAGTSWGGQGFQASETKGYKGIEAPGHQRGGVTSWGPYEYKGSGINKQGNHYCSRDYGLEAPNENSYHYSNRDGSYYYSNPDGSRYYNDGQGNGWWESPEN